MTQKERLLAYFRQHGRINPLQSWQALGIYRLAAVVLLLRKDGHDIETVDTEVKNQFGEKCHVATYVYHYKSWTQITLEALTGAAQELKEANDKYENA